LGYREVGYVGVLLFLLGMVWLDLALGFRASITVYAGCIQIGLGGLWGMWIFSPGLDIGIEPLHT